MNLTQRDLELISNASGVEFTCLNEIIRLSREEILNLANALGNLIGYDATTDNIDSLGLEADNVISKLLKILEMRGEM